MGNLMIPALISTRAQAPLSGPTLAPWNIHLLAFLAHGIKPRRWYDGFLVQQQQQRQQQQQQHTTEALQQQSFFMQTCLRHELSRIYQNPLNFPEFLASSSFKLVFNHSETQTIMNHYLYLYFPAICLFFGAKTPKCGKKIRSTRNSNCAAVKP